MSKFCGLIGYVMTEETKPGVWEEVVTEHQHYGDVIRNVRKLQSSGQVNDDVILANDISILADPFATENFQSMRYVVFMGTKWKVASVEVQYPRLILTLGGVYHGQQT